MAHLTPSRKLRSWTSSNSVTANADSCPLWGMAGRNGFDDSHSRQLEREDLERSQPNIQAPFSMDALFQVRPQRKVTSQT